MVGSEPITQFIEERHSTLMATSLTATSPPSSTSPLPKGSSLKPPSTVSPKSSRKSFTSVSDKRLSVVSTSAGSFTTAILDGAPTLSVNENTSSTAHPPHTLSLQPTSTNPVHILTTAQLNGDTDAEIHIQKATKGTVILQVGNQDLSLKSKLSYLGRTIFSGHMKTSDTLAAAAAGPDVWSENEIIENQRTNTILQTKVPAILPNGYIAPPSPPSSESLTEENSPVLCLQLTEEPLSTDANNRTMESPKAGQLSQPSFPVACVSYNSPNITYVI